MPTAKPAMPAKPPMPVTEALYGLTHAQLDLLSEALDSHIYWTLSDEKYRRDGYVSDPGSDDPETVELIKSCEDLGERILGCMQKLEMRATKGG